MRLGLARAGTSTWGKLTVEGVAGLRQIFHYHYLQWKDFNAPEHFL